MNIRLRNDWAYAGDDRWNWEIYLDSDSPNDLKEVEKVKYILHPTFENPIQVVDKEKDGFRLKTNGWGTFEVRAFAYLKNGKKIKLKHDLKLDYNPKTGSSS